MPQGSILGPLLFIIYKNDIVQASKLFKFILYADDTTLQSTLQSFGPGISQLNINKELEKISTWLQVNKLTLNVAKSKFMMFSSKKKLKKLPNLTLKLSGTIIERVDSFNFLGLLIDETLSWNPHKKHISIKISQTIGILKKLKKSLPTHILKTLYNSMILSKLNYGLLVWGHGNTTNILKLQKKAIRTITNSKYNAHTDPLFKKLGILKINDIFTSVFHGSKIYATKYEYTI